MTATEAGSSLRSKNSSEVMTQRPSTSKPGRPEGTDPAARTTLRPTTTRPASSPSTTSTRRSALRVPVPDRVVTLRPLSKPDRPLNSLFTTAFLRSWLTREVERHRGDVDAELLGALDRAVHGGRLEELLGRDAAAVQAGPADLVPLDDGDGQPRGGAVERGGVAARSAADHDDVELFLGWPSPVLFLSSRGLVRRVRLPRDVPIAPGGVLSASRACSPGTYRSHHRAQIGGGGRFPCSGQPLVPCPESAAWVASSSTRSFQRSPE